MKFTLLNSFLIFFLSIHSITAQNVVTVDSAGVAKENNSSFSVDTSVAKDTIKPFKRFKAEGVASVIGEYVIVEFDIDLSYIELKEQGVAIDEISRCQMLGKLMEDKLYAHHAKLDSLLVPDAEINGRIDQQIQYMVSELGSEEKVAEYYRKESISELRQQLFEVNKTLALATEMQQKITEEVEITPEEVREFFYKIPEDERPIFGAEVEVSQIVIEPQVTKKAEQEVIDRLNEIRAEVVEGGASFATRAVLYSKDGSASKGGLIPGIKRNSPYAKEFKDMAFSLLEGEVSEPFETSFGWHILYVDKIRGQEVDVRHIILFPQVSQSTIDEAKSKVETIRQQIVDGNISFEDAAKTYSDEKETRNNGGKLVNPVTGDTKFDLTKMDPTLGAQVYNLKKGEVSKVYTDRDYTGKSVFKILTVVNRYDEHPADYVKDYEKIQELALKEKKIRAIEKWQDKKIKETYVHVNEDYKDCEFSSNWVKQ
ncbi:peptidylprolyl isomerase [Constantimarinum furrinae]|uniref:Peptidyl-prolyl cis-trans isomerase SurA n=1 Tax=Constantimarinum furrinae TaxID=2562285 RepID=A0A7G8PQN1_9FLAO|nr:peptidylprolyl isomerase [Constantimarinum furrinae]QNJ96647.1 peptidyl-prolyl cis-trans isomerase SurA [Constantimarinum furrinae]